MNATSGPGVAMRLLLCLSPILLILSSNASSDAADDYEFIVVLKTLSVTLIGRENGSNLYPWLSESTPVGDGEVEIIVSNSCGFADYEYAGAMLAAYQQADWDEDSYETIAARGSIGEWCRLTTHLYEFEMLIVTRSQDGRRYIVDSADLFIEPGRRYLTDPDFIDEWMLEEFVQPIPDPGDRGSCYDTDKISLGFQRELERDGYQRLGDELCPVSGLFVDDIPVRVRTARHLRHGE